MYLGPVFIGLSDVFTEGSFVSVYKEQEPIQVKIESAASRAFLLWLNFPPAHFQPIFLPFQDGSAVEIVGLSFACIKKLAEFFKQGLYSHCGVKREEVKWSLSDWAEKIEKNFETHFFIQKENPKEKRNGK